MTQIGLLIIVVADPAIAPANILSNVVKVPPAANLAACVVAVTATTFDLEVRTRSLHLSKKK